MYKKCKVVMLPTDNKSKILKQLDANNHLIPAPDYNWTLTKNWKYQHLYILSSDEIKEGEWCYQTVIKQIIHCPFDTKSQDKFIGDFRYNKVIATTDSSLIIYNRPQVRGAVAHHSLLPSIPQSFIDKYVSEYNNGRSLEEVMVEYEYAKDNQTYYGCKCTEGFQGLCDNSFDDDQLCKLAIKLKLNSDNTINIKSIKDSWTRKEVKDILLNQLPLSAFNNEESMKKWIETNL